MDNLTVAIERAMERALTPDMVAKLTRRAIVLAAEDARNSLLARAFEAGDVEWVNDMPVSR